MKKKYLALPVPLRAQALLRTAFGCAFIASMVIMLILGIQPLITLPLLAATLFFWIEAYHILLGRYVLVKGKCTEVRRNLLQTRIKWIILNDNNGNTLRVRSSRLRANVRPNNMVTVYLDEKTRVYESNGERTVYDYWALSKEGDLTDGGR